jgi:type I restriction enzyme S subunit
VVPPKDIQNIYDNYIAPIFKHKEGLEEANTKIKQSRDLLLGRLISGKLSVENLDIQFPPSMEEHNA